ncbi:MAG: nucleotidyltransferase domain-containing protein, partial [Nitrososphaerales archaeon]
MDKRGFKDRDFIRTPEDFFFCVVGYLHPEDRVISYLRYLPSLNGKWGYGSARYARAMPSYTINYLLKNIKALRKDFSDYIFYSDVFNTQMSAVPHNKIKEHYRPERRLDEILRLKEPDKLQEKVIELATLTSNESGISRSYIGVTGSILINIHRPFSDIDLVVYGRDNSLKVKDALLSLYDKKESNVQKLHGDALYKWCEEKAKNYPLTFDEAKKIYDRKWNYGLFKDTNFSIHQIRLDSEITELYGDKVFSPMGMVKIRAKVSDTSESIFLPYNYSLQRVIVEEGKKVQDIRKVVTYESLYGGIFEIDDEIIAKGRLEKVLDKRTGEVYHQVLIGSLEGKGMDYIK